MRERKRGGRVERKEKEKVHIPHTNITTTTPTSPPLPQHHHHYPNITTTTPTSPPLPQHHHHYPNITTTTPTITTIFRHHSLLLHHAWLQLSHQGEDVVFHLQGAPAGAAREEPFHLHRQEGAPGGVVLLWWNDMV